MKLLAALALCVAFAAQAQAPLAEPRSARETATRIVRSLAAGDIEAAAALSNSPHRRREVLQDYRNVVGEAEFKRVFAQYLRQPILDELALGAHRLVIWDFVEADGRLAGQYFVEVDGRFLLDDVPSEARDQLRRKLQEYRKSRASRRTD